MLGWSFLLGQYGSDEDAERFKERVDGPWPLGDFLHGWNMARAGDDPVGSFTFVAQAIKDLDYDGIEWVRDFPEGVYYDRAAVAVVQKLWGSHPEEAREWARSIGDEKIRATQLIDIETIQRRETRREGR